MKSRKLKITKQIGELEFDVLPNGVLHAKTLVAESGRVSLVEITCSPLFSVGLLRSVLAKVEGANHD